MELISTVEFNRSPSWITHQMICKVGMTALFANLLANGIIGIRLGDRSIMLRLRIATTF